MGNTKRRMNNLLNEISIQQIAHLNWEARNGQVDTKEYLSSMGRIVENIYRDGKESGMVEALNYVSNSSDRDKLFSAIGDIQEERDNEC